MFKKAKALWALMQVGKVVADPAKWKTRSMEGAAITAVLWGAVNTAAAFGVEVPVDESFIDALAVVVLTVGYWVFTIITTDKIGLQPNPGADNEHQP
jgi:hypothetical protein